MDIYIKPIKKCSMAERKKILLRDIAEVYAPDDLLQKVKKVKVFEITDDDKKPYVVSVIDVIDAIDKAMPGHTINNVGEMDTIIDYAPEKSKDNPIWKWTKIIFVALLLLSGSATAIMGFHSDSEMPQIFKSYYQLFFDESTQNTAILDIPYSIGLAVGIIAFFNHFGGKMITQDPTPIEVEMTIYEADVTDTMIDMLNVEKEKNKDGKNNKK